MKLLVVGAGGQVGSALREARLEAGETLVALARTDLDIADTDAIRTVLVREKPDVVINAAAYTDVERAETEPHLAELANARGPANLASVSHEHGAALIHLSTDFVFDGLKGAPYIEGDLPLPQGVYARTKLEGEGLVASLNARSAIVRTAWVYSAGGRNFVRTMLRLASERPEVSVVADQRGNPTAAVDIAAGLVAIARRVHAEPANTNLYGLVHMAAPDDAVWADLAEATFAASKALGGLSVPVRRISTGEFPTKVRRPPDSRLDCSRLREVFGVVLPSWRDSLRSCVGRIMAGRGQPTGT